MGKIFLLFTQFVVLFSAYPAMGADLYVNKQGADINTGTQRDQAFLTIQRGVSALAAGDTLNIGPGEYFESVLREDLGTASIDTLIRAEIAGTVTLRGDVPAPVFEPVAGYRFVYSASVAQVPGAVIDHAALRVLSPKATVAELEFEPGFFHYDAVQQRLYLSNADFSGPETARYSLSVIASNGLTLRRPLRVIVEGIAATGFNPGWGIFLSDPNRCVVRDCTSYMNVGGIQLGPDNGVIGNLAGANNLVERCTCYGNSFGGIVRYSANNDVIQNCYVYKNVKDNAEHFGIMHYLTMHGPLQLLDNISWGHNYDFSVKPGGQQESLQRCTGLGHIRINTQAMNHNLLAGPNEYGASVTPDNILMNQEAQLDKNVEFADPLNLDFRLQSDSRFRNAGGDRGPQSYQENIFYLSPAGSDLADGLSLRTPWRTLAHALSNLEAGDTLYLSAGEYAAPNNWTPERDGASPIRICGRGREVVVITNLLSVTSGSNISFQQLHFSGGVTLLQSEEISFKNCTFFDQPTTGLVANAVTHLMIQHCVFRQAPLRLVASTGLHLAGNLFAQTNGASLYVDDLGSIRYADYNNYQTPTGCWNVSNSSRSLAQIQPLHETYSHTLTPQFVITSGVPKLSNSNAFISRGPASSAIGIYHEYEESTLSLNVVGPFLYSAHDTTANIEWWFPYPAQFSVSWGTTPAMVNRNDYCDGSRARFNTISLTNLAPATTYYFKITNVRALYGQQDFPEFTPTNGVITFTTAAAPVPPRNLYVAPDGSDSYAGLSRQTAFKTLAHAADVVVPGDTVWIAGGRYNETIRMRVTGTPSRPITFRNLPKEKVVHVAENVPRAFEMIYKSDYRVDGLYFEADFWREGFLMRYSPRVQVTRCFNAMVYADDCPDLLIKNCVLQGGWSSVHVDGSPYTGDRTTKAPARIENNVFIMTILRQVEADFPIILRNNIFCENIRGKTRQQLLDLPLGPMLKEETDNCFYFRWPESERLAVNGMPLYQYRAKTGSHSFAANPMMINSRGFVQGYFHYDFTNFDDLFATNPQLVQRDIGLQPGAFADLPLNVATWAFNGSWANTFIQAELNAKALADAGNYAGALAAYTVMTQTVPLSDRLKSDLLEKASRLAQQLNNFTEALSLAERIPEESLSKQRQMQLFIARGQYTELLNRFTDEAMRQRSPHGYIYPELEDILCDLLYYRSLAYAHTGDLVAAEEDLKVINSRRAIYSSGEAIHDLAWLRLGDFYRTYLHDDGKALQAYLNVCSRTTFDNDPKPVASGASDTFARATQAAVSILRAQGRETDAVLLKDQWATANAAALSSGWAATPWFLGVGDSILAGYASSDTATKNPIAVMQAAYPAATFVNRSVSGSTISANTNASTALMALATATPTGYSKYTIILLFGHNDIAANDSVATIQANLTTWITTTRRLYPGVKIVGCTLHLVNFGGNQALFEPRRQALNTWIRGRTVANGHTNGYDAVCDIAANSRLGTDFTNATYYNNDQVHLTDVGYSVWAGLMQATLIANGFLTAGTAIIAPSNARILIQVN